MTETADVLDIRVRVLGLERVTNGPAWLLALCIVELEIAGLVMTLQAVQLIRRHGRIEVQAPQTRTASGAWRPAVILPTNVWAAVLEQIAEAAALHADAAMALAR